ncbi:MAG: chemotaxis protein CheD [Gemmatimonadaceae bacterium]|nr:chemotaxis protein CheD [Gemmatimonadaceae bacterium]
MQSTDSMADRVIGIADMAVSASSADRLVTYALGSCLGVCVHDPVAGVAGLLHVMLPSSDIDPQKAQRKPYMFVDTGVPELFRAAYRAGAQKERLIVKVIGGASTGDGDQPDAFQVGKRNVLTLKKLLWKNGVILRAEDVGGQRLSRTVFLQVSSGEVLVKTNGREATL